MVSANFKQFGHDLCAGVFALRAAGVKGAALRHIRRAGYVAGEYRALFFDTRVGHGNGREQGAGIRVLRIAAEGVAVRDFHDTPQVHHRDAVGDVSDNAQVVRDEQKGKAEPGLKILEKIDDLRLNRHIQGGDGFVRNE